MNLLCTIAILAYFLSYYLVIYKEECIARFKIKPKRCTPLSKTICLFHRYSVILTSNLKYICRMFYNKILKIHFFTRPSPSIGA